MNALFGEEVGDGGVDKLRTIVGLHSNERTGKLGASIGDKIYERVSSIRFLTKRKSPHKVREIINNNKEIFETGNT